MILKSRRGWIVLVFVLASAFGGCMHAYRQSLGGDTNRVFHRIYLADQTAVWQAALEALKSYRLDVTNREGGYIQTRWTDNTLQRNFIDSFGSTDSLLKAQFRYRLTVAEGFFNGRPSVKVTVQKEQMVQRDVLEGWTGAETDSIEEKTLLYRIGQIITVRARLARLDEEKAKAILEPSAGQ